MTKRLPARYQKIRKEADGYKKGYRYIDYGSVHSTTHKVRLLKHRPRY